MDCNHTACWVDRDGRQHRLLLPGLDTSCYATGDVVTVGEQHLLLKSAHRQHYGWNNAALSVSWDVAHVAKPAPHLTRERD